MLGEIGAVPVRQVVITQDHRKFLRGKRLPGRLQCPGKNKFGLDTRGAQGTFDQPLIEKTVFDHETCLVLAHRF